MQYYIIKISLKISKYKLILNIDLITQFLIKFCKLVRCNGYVNIQLFTKEMESKLLKNKLELRAIYMAMWVS